MDLFIGYKILSKLLDSERVLAKDLAKELETSTRTIYRYINALANSGVPIESKIGRNGGIEIDKSFKIDNCFFSEDEMTFLKTNLTPLAAYGSATADSILCKLKLL